MYVQSTHQTLTQNLHMSALKKCPWKNISLDLYSPLSSGDYLEVIVDEYSIFTVVETTRSLADIKIIPITDKLCAMFAYLIVMKTDNRTPFQIKLLSEFCIHHNMKQEDYSNLASSQCTSRAL